MLIGETLHLSFAGYVLEAALPVGLGLAAAWVGSVSRGAT